MTSRPSRRVRFLTLLLAAMQFAVPALVSVADGSVARAGRTSAAHVEEVGGKQCRPPHSEDCLICRFLSAAHSVASTAATCAAAEEIASLRAALATSPAAGALYGFNSRAPPIS
jgi:hypothetical protein